MRRNPLVQAIILIAAAAVLAIVANGFASRTRRLVLPGYYPNALRVPLRPPEAVVPRQAATTATGGAVSFSPPSTTAEPASSPSPPPVASGEPAVSQAPPNGMQKPAAPSPMQAEGGQKPGTPQPAAANPLARFQPHPGEAAVEISGSDAALLHANGALFLDARRSAAYEEGHIAGARPFSVWESDIDDKVNALYEERSDASEQNQPIVIYCTGGACEDSHMLAQKLWGIQFNNVYVYKDGFPDWQKRRGAVSTGGKP